VNARLLENNDFGVYVEQEPYVRELIDAYMGSKFKTVLELLDKFSVRLHISVLFAG
jgi:COP9 signalosome complex subunit 1